MAPRTATRKTSIPQPATFPTVPIHPQYGKAFRCIGPDCEDTCCHGTTVLLDKATYDRYQAFQEGKLQSLVQLHVSRNSVDSSDALHARIAATPANDCVFFDVDRLCSIQKGHGVDALSATCSIYPRALNYAEGRLEVSLYLSCPEAARNILLQPGSTQIVPDPPFSPFRRDQVPSLASGRDGSPHKPYAYFAETRAWIVAALQARAHPLWQRLFLVGMLCRRLDAIAAPEQDEAVPAILDGLRRKAAGAVFREIDAMPAQPAVQLDAVLRMTDQRIRAGGCGQRFAECFQVFIQGIGYSPQSSPQSDLRHYVEAEQRYWRPFAARHPFILENYLLNYCYRALFPFGRQASAHHAARSIFAEYMLMVAQYAVIRGLLIGMAGHYRDAFCADHVVKLVQSFSKAVEHGPASLKDIDEFLRSRNLWEPAGIAALLR